jgi:HAD superfamily hydrolase (TIGR01509 family)
MKYKYFIFDLDGVLVHSEHLYSEAKKKVLTNHSVDVSTLDISLYQGQTDTDFFKAMKQTYPDLMLSAQELASESEKIFKEEMYTQMLPMPGASEFILRLVEKGVGVANVTSATSISQSFALELLKVKKHFSVLVNANNVTEYKPSPVPYLTALKDIKVDINECLVIEDTVSGVLSARAAGLTVCGFGATFPEQALRNAGASLIAKTYEELSNIVFNQNF